ncbi:MAG: hypothetical protein ACO3CL_06870 [Bacteroidia bacterium]
MALTSAFLEEILALLPEEQVLTSATEAYGRDETEDWLFVPDIVVFPDQASEVAAVFGFC